MIDVLVFISLLLCCRVELGFRQCNVGRKILAVVLTFPLSYFQCLYIYTAHPGAPNPGVCPPGARDLGY